MAVGAPLSANAALDHVAVVGLAGCWDCPEAELVAMETIIVASAADSAVDELLAVDRQRRVGESVAIDSLPEIASADTQAMVSALQPIFTPVVEAAPLDTLEESSPQEAAYVDQLIDPDVAEDAPIIDGATDDSVILGRRVFVAEARARTTNRLSGGPASDEQGVALSYARETAQYGTFGIDASANRFDGDLRAGVARSDVEYDGAVALYQQAFPVTADHLMDNVAGMQRVFPTMVGSLGYRSQLQYPSMLGLSTRVYDEDGSEFRASVGQLGDFGGGVFRSWDATDGNAGTVSYATPPWRNLVGSR